MVRSLGGSEDRAIANAEEALDCDPKTYNGSNSLLHSICDFGFIFGLMVLKLI